MNLASWGNYPSVNNNALSCETVEQLRDIICRYRDMIPYGNGRSYGDSALSANIIDTRKLCNMLSFNEDTGVLHCQAGVFLSDIVSVFLPRGWFLSVTPGTKLITVGGAIASDVHGKNHHIEGCFSSCVKEFTLMVGTGEMLTCSASENAELFRATCGGMGLTGVITDAKIVLKKVRSAYIDQVTVKTKNLQETFDAFEQNHAMPYSVAWIDCLAMGKRAGRCVLMAGDFRQDGQLDYKPPTGMNVPVMFPSFVLNKAAVKTFNWLYYAKSLNREKPARVDADAFFYPLDAVKNWNRMYGKGGFTQYQCIFPKNKSYEGLERILHAIAESGKGSFLAVLKLYGKANENYLSFPMEGYSLALDFKIEPGVFSLLDSLDRIVLEYSGRIYLTKDVRVTRDVFEQGYPYIDRFRKVRKEYGLEDKFSSLQSKRVGI